MKMWTVMSFHRTLFKQIVKISSLFLVCEEKQLYPLNHSCFIHILWNILPQFWQTLHIQIDSAHIISLLMWLGKILNPILGQDIKLEKNVPNGKIQLSYHFKEIIVKISRQSYERSLLLSNSQWQEWAMNDSN